jgi:hypothetical protein
VPMKPAVARIATSVLRIQMLLFRFNREHRGFRWTEVTSHHTALSSGSDQPRASSVHQVVHLAKSLGATPSCTRSEEGFRLRSARAARPGLLAADGCRIFPGCAGVAGMRW